MMRIFVLATAALGITAISAQATEICKSYDQSQWMSKEDITKKVTEMGYDVRLVQAEDGCWEVKGTKDGARVEAYFDPVNAKLVLTK